MTTDPRRGRRFAIGYKLAFALLVFGARGEVEIGDGGFFGDAGFLEEESGAKHVWGFAARSRGFIHNDVARRY